MAGWSPPSPSPIVTKLLLAVWLLFLGYALVAMQNVLVGVLPGLIGIGGYYAWRLLVAVEATADGVHRLADEGQEPGEES